MTPASLDEQGCRRIHAAALQLLGDVGCAVLDPEALDLLAAHGAAVDGRRARFGEDLVVEALATAPAGYTVAGRRPELDVNVGLGAPPVLGSASGPAFVLDGEMQRPGTLADLRMSIALAHLSPNIELHGISVTPCDVSESGRTRAIACAHAIGSDKMARHTVANLAELQVAMDVAEILYGARWHERPRLWTNINTTSPLQFSAEGAQMVVRLARLGQPVCVAVCAMGGTTAPLTLAGLLAVQHAELLSGLVLTQLAQPGCPFLYGGTSSLSSMQSGALMMGTPEYWALMDATVRLGHWLGLPVRAGGSLTDAHLPDAQAGIESALAIKTVLDLGVDVVLHAAGILSSFNCYSPVKFVIDDEVLSAVRVAGQQIVIDDQTLAFDMMAAVGPGGSVLGQAHTRRHARDGRRTTIMNRVPFQTWRGLGGGDLADVAAQRVVESLEAYVPPDDLDAVTRRQLDVYCLA
ncbi:MAG TPA: trimethylamine methyltransferase family protein [Thermoleophilia bacterium]|nr:trimethylamine methyltransferase family protein [Thermoleophilia bacterium]